MHVFFLYLHITLWLNILTWGYLNDTYFIIFTNWWNEGYFQDLKIGFCNGKTKNSIFKITIFKPFIWQPLWRWYRIILNLIKCKRVLIQLNKCKCQFSHLCYDENWMFEGSNTGHSNEDYIQMPRNNYQKPSSFGYTFKHI